MSLLEIVLGDDNLINFGQKIGNELELCVQLCGLFMTSSIIVRVMLKNIPAFVT